VPLRYMHTPYELLSLKDIEDSARLMVAYCCHVKPDATYNAN
jgi:putative aminopeptidase FrvX